MIQSRSPSSDKHRFRHEFKPAGCASRSVPDGFGSPGERSLGTLLRHNLYDAFLARELSLRKKVDGLAANQILSLPGEQLAVHLVTTNRIEPRQIFGAEKVLDPRETKVDVSG
jgi:hypothetical protein